MTLLFPAALFLAVTIPAAVFLYLRRPLRRKEEVSSLFFWQRILNREPRHRFLGKLRNPLSLLIALLILALLLLALAKPEFARPPGKQHTVVMLDLRARMQAEPTFAKALATALQIAAAAGPDEEIAILGIAGSPQVISPFSTDAGDLRKRLAGQVPTDGGGSLETTLQLARRLLESRVGAKRILLITDRPMPNPEGVEVMAVGKSRDNIAILDFAQRALPASPQSAEILVKVGNFADEPRDVEFELALDGRAIDLQSLRVDAGGQADFSTRLPAQMLRDSEGLLTVHLTAADGLAVDDSARAVYPKQSRLRVLLLTAGDPYLENALRADAGIALEILTPNHWREGMGADFDCVIWDDNLPVNATFASLGPGNYFFLGRTPFGSEAGGPATAVEQSQSPLLWNVDLSKVQFSSTQKMRVPETDLGRSQVVLRNAEEPLLVMMEGPDGRRSVAAGFSVASSTLPLRAGFPLFINNVVHWLAGGKGNVLHGKKSGETIIPAANTEIAREPREKGGSSARSSAPLFLARNGFYELRAEGVANWVAVNTADGQESDLRLSADTGNIIAIASRFAGLQPWQWLAIGALLLLTIEWTMHHRRLTE